MLILPVASTASVMALGSVRSSSWRARERRQERYVASVRTSVIAGRLSSVRTYKHCAIEDL